MALLPCRECGEPCAVPNEMMGIAYDQLHCRKCGCMRPWLTEEEVEDNYKKTNELKAKLDFVLKCIGGLFLLICVSAVLQAMW